MDDTTLVSLAVWIVFGQAILALGLFLEWHRRRLRKRSEPETTSARKTGPDESAGSE